MKFIFQDFIETNLTVESITAKNSVTGHYQLHYQLIQENDHPQSYASAQVLIIPVWYQ